MRRLLFVFLLLFVAAPAHAEWWEAKTDHFIVYSESSEREAREFAEKLERFDRSLRSLQNIRFDKATSDSRRLTVFRTGDVGDIGQLAGSSGVAGFYIPRLGGSVAFTPARDSINTGSLLARYDSRTELEPLTVLFHEYAHHFMFQHFSAAYPSWYVEGLAETYATIVLNEDGSFHLGNPPQYRSDALFNWVNVPVKRMLTSTNKPTGEDFLGRYTVGWLLTHYLTFEPSRQGQLKKYLVLINKGVDPSEAAVQAFGDLARLDREIHGYKGGKLPGALVRPANTEAPQVEMRRLAPDEEAVMRVKMRSKRGVSHKTRDDVAEDAREVAARYPNSFAAQLELSEAEFDAEQLDAAERAADRALAIRPDSVEAMIRKGMVHLERGRTDKSQLAIARGWFAKAFEADPEHPAPLYYNYMTYHEAGGAIPEVAIIGLERAYKFAPFDQELRLVLSRQLLSEGKGPLARSILIQDALAPHESKRAKELREVVALIDNKDVPGARAKLAGLMDEWDRKRRSGEDES